MAASKGRKTILKAVPTVVEPEPGVVETSEPEEPYTNPGDDTVNGSWADDAPKADEHQDARADATQTAVADATQTQVADATQKPFDAPETKQTVVIGEKHPVDVGHPDGQKRLPWVQPSYAGMPSDGVVLAPRDPLYVRGISRGVVVELTENVYRAIQPGNSHSYTFGLVFNRGARIDASRVMLITDR